MAVSLGLPPGKSSPMAVRAPQGLEFEDVVSTPRQSVQVRQSAPDRVASTALYDSGVGRIRGMTCDLDRKAAAAIANNLEARPLALFC
jgi:hypothetical protein